MENNRKRIYKKKGFAVVRKAWKVCRFNGRQHTQKNSKENNNNDSVMFVTIGLFNNVIF